MRTVCRGKELCRERDCALTVEIKHFLLSLPTYPSNPLYFCVLFTSSSYFIPDLLWDLKNQPIAAPAR